MTLADIMTELFTLTELFRFRSAAAAEPYSLQRELHLRQYDAAIREKFKQFRTT